MISLRQNAIGCGVAILGQRERCSVGRDAQLEGSREESRYRAGVPTSIRRERKDEVLAPAGRPPSELASGQCSLYSRDPASASRTVRAVRPGDFHLYRVTPEDDMARIGPPSDSHLEMLLGHIFHHPSFFWFLARAFLSDSYPSIVGRHILHLPQPILRWGSDDLKEENGLIGLA